MPSSTLLASLIAIATLVGAILHHHHSPSVSENAAEKIAHLQREVEVLRAETETLKLIQSGNGEISLPIDLYTFVEKNIGMEFPSHIQAFRTDRDKLIEAEEYRWIKHFNLAGIENRQYAFELIGILPPDSKNFAHQLGTAASDTDLGLLGVYDPHPKELLLHTSFDPENPAHQTEAVRLLTIALLESCYPVDPALSDDAFLSRDAIIRARADMVAARFHSIYFPNEKAPSSGPRIAEDRSKFVKSIAHFYHVTGRRYIEQLALKQRDLFPELYQFFPRQSATLYLQVPFIKKLPKPKSPGPSAQKNPKKQVLIASELGQVYLRVLLDRLSSEQPKLHTDLAYDHLTFTQETAQAEYPQLEWTLTWIGEEPAKTFTTLYNQSGGYATAKRQGNVVTISLKYTTSSLA